MTTFKNIILCLLACCLFTFSNAQKISTPITKITDKLDKSPSPEIDPEAITIIRDEWGVPHIYGETDEETAYGFAWAQCEDDFETVEWRILSGQRRLGEVYGKDGAKVDFVAHLLRIDDVVAERYHEDFSADFQDVISGFVQGLNDYAAQHPEDVSLKGVFPLTNQEYITACVLSTVLMCKLDIELKRIFSGYAHILEPKESMKGSNAIAIAPERTDNSKTYLAMNPHQPYEGPFSWYEAHVHSEEGWDMLGATFPGCLPIFIGTNNKLGWTHTVNHPDLIDVYKLDMHPEYENMYNFDGAWKELEVHEAPLKVKVALGAKIKVTKKVYQSVYGPTVKTDHGFYAIRMPAMMRVGALEQWFLMDKAQNHEEFIEAMKMQQIPSMNTVYADVEGNIFYLNNGLFPYRNPNYNWKHVLPGNTSETLWEEGKFQPFEALPMIANPNSGYVFNTNNTPFNASCDDDNLCRAKYDPTMGFREFDNNRSRRLKFLMENEDEFTYEDFKRIKYDRSLPDSIDFEVNIAAVRELDPVKYPDIAEGLAKIKAWDGTSEIDNEDAAIVLLAWDYVYREVDLRTVEYQWNTRLSDDFYAEAVVYAQKYLRKHFGTLDVPLGNIQRHIRGDVDLPLGGFAEVLAVTFTKEHKKGKRRAFVGDSYIGMAQYSKDGVEVETLVPYGASNRPDSPHYTDQMEMYVNQDLKKMSLKREEIMKTAESVYFPGQENRQLVVKD